MCVCVCVFDPPPKIMKIKTKLRYDLSTLKSFCTTKEAMNKTKKSSELEKIFANEVTTKRLISKIYKQFIQLN